MRLSPRFSSRHSSITPIVAPVGALLLLVAAAVPARAQDWSGRGRVNGVVTDEATKKPIAGAQVTLRRGDAPDAGPALIKTDKKGHWGYLGLAGGAWAVRIEAEGYVPSEGSIKVDEFGVNPQIQISLRTMASVAPKEDAALTALQKTLDTADSLLQQKKPAEARAEYEKALPELEGNNRAIVLKRIATAQMLEGNDAGAVDTLKQALEINPADEVALKLIVDRLIVLKRDDEAQQYIARMPAGAALDSNTMLNQGINDYNAGKYPEAIAKFEQVVAAKPDFADAYYYRGLAQLASGKTVEAKADFEKVLALDPNGEHAAECKDFLKSL
jgi:Tfp pilus assembly protein PilF